MPLRRYIAPFFLAVFLFAITPHELIHDLAGHYDTVDPISATTSVSAKHIHCEILQVQLLPFSRTASSFSLTPQSVNHRIITSSVAIFVSTSAVKIATRGPPSC